MIEALKPALMIVLCHDFWWASSVRNVMNDARSGIVGDRGWEFSSTSCQAVMIVVNPEPPGCCPDELYPKNYAD